MSERHEQRAIHPRTGTSTGVIEENPSASRPVRRASRMDIQEAAPLQPGSVVAGRYRIERLLGVGGMGAVYEATQVAIDRRVALKVVRADFAGDVAMAARFQREARAASAVHHPNVVMVHDFGQGDDGTLFLVMELLAGESLLQRMRRERCVPPRDAVRIACEVLSALEAAHEAGVVHRDLKPDNVLLLDKPQVSSSAPAGAALKVLDFGIARIVDRAGAEGGPRPSDAAGLTEVGQMLGTPRYMSPEAVARLPVGPAADLYSLGAILFEMIAGRPVFTEKEPVILMGHHLRTPAPRLRETAPAGVYVPRPLDDLVTALLSKLPTDRPGSAATVRKALLELDWEQPAAEVHAKIFTPPPDAEVARVHFVRGKSPLRRAMRFSPLVLLAAGIAGLLYLHRMRLEERREEEQSQIGVIAHEEAPPPEEPVLRRIEHVRMTLSGAPESATYTWDGEEMPASTFDVPFDSRSHRLVVSARGYQPREVDVVADGPHELDVTLSRARRGRVTKASTPR
ncbi:MAG: serine/threonine protein kinase [Myxococcota bacterium]|nr:serine/threonine protein kinase [Myxococcota bacterium]